MRFLTGMALALVATPAFAQEADDRDGGYEAPIGGLRVEVHAGIERPNLNESEGGVDYVAKLSSAFAYGAEIGYDIPVSDSFTVGPFVAYDLANSDICETGADGLGSYELCFAAKSNLAAGLRGAAALGNRGELYLSLGYAKYDYDYTEVYRNSADQITAVYANTDGDEGIDVSMGYNHMLSDTFYAGLGMRITELGDFEGTSANLQRFQGQVNLGARF